MFIGKIILYSWSTINAYSLISHEWWVLLIKFMMKPTIYMREEAYAFMVYRKYLIIFLSIEHSGNISLDLFNLFISIMKAYIETYSPGFVSYSQL